MVFWLIRGVVMAKPRGVDQRGRFGLQSKDWKRIKPLPAMADLKPSRLTPRQETMRHDVPVWAVGTVREIVR